MKAASIVNWYRDLPGSAQVVCGVLAAGFALLFFLVAARGLSWYLEGNERLLSSEPRYARLQGFIQHVDALRASNQQIGDSLSELAYPADEGNASVAAVAQQQLRRLLDTAGMQVSGSQVLSPTEHAGLVEIRLQLDASGPMEALEQALVALRDARPMVFVSSLEIAPVQNRQRNAPVVQNVSLSLQASVVKLQ